MDSWFPCGGVGPRLGVGSTSEDRSVFTERDDLVTVPHREHVQPFHAISRTPRTELRPSVATRAVFNCHRPPLEDEEVEARVTTRHQRQQLLQRRPAQLISCVLEKIALTRPFGRPAGPQGATGPRAHHFPAPQRRDPGDATGSSHTRRPERAHGSAGNGRT
ncbi:Scr1 family TA system antitoxin-like transcriptional regulator [Streptomyces sp. NPDC051320]|uniref:Scr1 family TA system antitoxin-like transcriptional regulator n=1 Tax=Streptomyces sp. NPDC051320 TaxID=3154644 RepID=UPI0034192805